MAGAVAVYGDHWEAIVNGENHDIGSRGSSCRHGRNAFPRILNLVGGFNHILWKIKHV